MFPNGTNLNASMDFHVSHEACGLIWFPNLGNDPMLLSNDNYCVGFTKSMIERVWSMGHDMEHGC